jgi:hypothetical protein
MMAISTRWLDSSNELTTVVSSMFRAVDSTLRIARGVSVEVKFRLEHSQTWY